MHRVPPIRRPLRSDRRLACWLLLALVVLLPRVAHAHAHLRRSDPAAGARVAPPTRVRLWFSEEPEVALTALTLEDSAGTRMELGVPVRDPANALGVTFSIRQPLAPGRYLARWRTAAADGHPSSGTFAFVVTGVPSSVATPAPVAPRAIAPDTAGPARAAPSATDRPYVIVRLVSYAALLALVGAVVFRFAIVGRLAPLDAGVRRAMERNAARGAIVAAAVFVVAAAVRLAMQGRLVRDAAVDAAALEAMAMGTRWGGVWRVQLAAGVLALASAVLAWRERRVGWMVAAVACVVLALATALGGHAATAERLRTAMIIADMVHVLAASAWLGTLFWVVVAGLGAPLDAGSTRAGHVVSLVGAFSPVALVSASLVGLTGLFAAWQRLDAPSALWTTPYGQALVRKLVMVALVVVLGAVNWRWVRPALGTDAAHARLRRTASAELAMSLVVLLFTAILVATPTQ